MAQHRTVRRATDIDLDSVPVDRLEAFALACNTRAADIGGRQPPPGYRPDGVENCTPSDAPPNLPSFRGAAQFRHGSEQWTAIGHECGPGTDDGGFVEFVLHEPHDFEGIVDLSNMSVFELCQLAAAGRKRSALTRADSERAALQA